MDSSLPIVYSTGSNTQQRYQITHNTSNIPRGVVYTCTGLSYVAKCDRWCAHGVISTRAVAMDDSTAAAAAACLAEGSSALLAVATDEELMRELIARRAAAAIARGQPIARIDEPIITTEPNWLVQPHVSVANRARAAGRRGRKAAAGVLSGTSERCRIPMRKRPPRTKFNVRELNARTAADGGALSSEAALSALAAADAWLRQGARSAPRVCDATACKSAAGHTAPRPPQPVVPQTFEEWRLSMADCAKRQRAAAESRAILAELTSAEDSSLLQDAAAAGIVTAAVCTAEVVASAPPSLPWESDCSAGGAFSGRNDMQGFAQFEADPVQGVGSSSWSGVLPGGVASGVV